jgi:hypothetical protein
MHGGTSGLYSVLDECHPRGVREILRNAFEWTFFFVLLQSLIFAYELGGGGKRESRKLTISDSIEFYSTRVID